MGRKNATNLQRLVSAQKVELVPRTELAPAAYNPRETSPERLELLRLSLRKLGFILPIYATPEGHLLSGHQRLLSAELEGYTHVPVVRIAVGLEKVKQINVVFNRMTNDMAPQDTSSKLYQSINTENLMALAEALPDIDPNDHPQAFPCMYLTDVNPAAVLQNDERLFSQASAAMCSKALSHGIYMPVVLDDGGAIVNGLYRLQNAASEGVAKWKAITISKAKGELAKVLTNFISMNFTLEKQYADTLRYGSFRRPNNLVYNLVQCMRFFADGYVPRNAETSLKHPHVFWRNWRTMHGNSVLDFGAGQCRNSTILAKKGIACANFEPYPVPWDDTDGKDKSVPSLELSRQICGEFLKLVAKKTHWDSIFMSAVLNSVAFHKDRMVCLAIVHACCSYSTRVFGTTAAVTKLDVDVIRPVHGVDGGRKKGQAKFELEHETNTTIGDINVMPKVQKYHTVEELEVMLSRFWNTVNIFTAGGGYYAYECAHPKRINHSALKAALLHEFELPYPDDQRIGLSKEALQSFSTRLGVDLESVEAMKL